MVLDPPLIYAIRLNGSILPNCLFNFYIPVLNDGVKPGPGVIKLLPCSTQLSTKFILLMNVKKPTIVGILTFISMINTTSERLKQVTSLFVGILVFYEQFEFRAQLSLA